MSSSHWVHVWHIIRPNVQMSKGPKEAKERAKVQRSLWGSHWKGHEDHPWFLHTHTHHIHTPPRSHPEAGGRRPRTTRRRACSIQLLILLFHSVLAVVTSPTGRKRTRRKGNIHLFGPEQRVSHDIKGENEGSLKEKEQVGVDHPEPAPECPPPPRLKNQAQDLAEETHFSLSGVKRFLQKTQGRSSGVRI